jgi:hypothetical protein
MSFTALIFTKLKIIQYGFIYLPPTELSKTDKKMYKIRHIFIYAVN